MTRGSWRSSKRTSPADSGALRIVRLTLIRHGQTHSNVGRHLDTAAPGADLTDLGRRQAAALVSSLAEHDVDSIFVSKLVRTHQTAAPLAAHRGLVPVELPGLHEITAGDFEMRNDDEAMFAYISTFQAWSLEGLHVAVPGGESGEEFFARFDADVLRAATESAAPVIVSHGAAIRVWAAERAMNVGVAETAGRELLNTGIVELEGDPVDGWRLIRWQGEALQG